MSASATPYEHDDQESSAALVRAPLPPWVGRLALRVAVLAGLLGLWEVIAALHIWPPIFVPSPAAVWHELIQASTTHDGHRGYDGVLLYAHVWASLRRVLVGVAAALAVGLPLGLLLGLSDSVRVVFEPVVTFVRSLPPLAYFSLLIIWFGIDETPKIVLLALAALPPIVLAACDGVRNVSEDRLLALRSLGAGHLQVITKGILPSALPEVMTGVRIAVGFAFTTLVAAETVNGMPGIGGVVLDAQRFNQTAVVVLGIIVIGVCGIALDGLVRLADRLLVPWRGHG